MHSDQDFIEFLNETMATCMEYYWFSQSDGEKRKWLNDFFEYESIKKNFLKSSPSGVPQ